MTQDDVLFGYRLQLFALAARTSVCARVPDLRGASLDLLRVEAPGRPARAGDAAPARAAAAADAQPVAADDRGADRELLDRASRARAASASRRELARPKWGGDRRLAQRGLEGALPPRAQHARQAARADRRLRRALRAAARTGARAPHRRRPAGRAGRDRLLLTSGVCAAPSGAIWQLTAIDVFSSFAWAELVICPQRQPDRGADQQARPPRRARPQAAGWRLERVLSDNGNEFRGLRVPRRRSSASAPATAASTPAARRPTATSKRSTRRSSTNAGGPPSRATSTRATPACAANSTPTSHFYNHDRVHHGRLTRGRIPADIVYGARKMEPR